MAEIPLPTNFANTEKPPISFIGKVPSSSKPVSAKISAPNCWTFKASGVVIYSSNIYFKNGSITAHAALKLSLNTLCVALGITAISALGKAL